MRYVLAETEKAMWYGFKKITHRVVGDMMILNEKELMANANLDGEVEERAELVGGEVLTENELLSKLNEMDKLNITED